MRRARVAGLDVVLSGGPDREGGGSGPMLVLLHGYGAPGEDLVALGRQMAVDRETRFAFPAAPLALSAMPGGRAWWPIDMVELQRAVMQRDYELFTTHVPEGLADARGAVLELLDALERDYGAPRERLVLGGFSQGAMLATDVTLRAERPPAGLVVLSGSLITRGDWIPLMKNRSGLPVVQSHGRQDPLLAYELAEALRREMQQAGLVVDFHAWNGGHGIPDSALTAMARLMATLKG